MEALLNAMRGEAERVAAQGTGTRYGIITSYDPDGYAVKVLRQPEGVETGWMPITTVWGGDGWGLLAGPEVGAQVKLEHQEDGTESAMCDGTLYSVTDRPLIEGLGGVPSGELWLVHKSGTRFRLLNDSAFEIRHKTGSQVRLLEDSTIETVHRDGTRQRFLPDGSMEAVHRDGSRIRLLADKGIELVQADGSRVHLHPDGAIEMKQARGSFVALHASGSVEIRAPKIEAAAVGAAAVRLLHEAFVTLYNSHTHGTGGPPNQQATADYLTASLTGR